MPPLKMSPFILSLPLQVSVPILKPFHMLSQFEVNLEDAAIIDLKINLDFILFVSWLEYIIPI